MVHLAACHHARAESKTGNGWSVTRDSLMADFLGFNSLLGFRQLRESCFQCWAGNVQTDWPDRLMWAWEFRVLACTVQISPSHGTVGGLHCHQTHCHCHHMSDYRLVCYCVHVCVCVCAKVVPSTHVLLWPCVQCFMLWCGASRFHTLEQHSLFP